MLDLALLNTPASVAVTIRGVEATVRAITMREDRILASACPPERLQALGPAAKGLARVALALGVVVDGLPLTARRLEASSPSAAAALVSAAVEELQRRCTSAEMATVLDAMERLERFSADDARASLISAVAGEAASGPGLPPLPERYAVSEQYRHLELAHLGVPLDQQERMTPAALAVAFEWVEIRRQEDERRRDHGRRFHAALHGIRLDPAPAGDRGPPHAIGDAEVSLVPARA
jgi:hypothetical protein